jgi:hypothetical protein
MAQVSTGMGLAILGGCILGVAALTSHKFGSEAMAQGTGTERRIVSAGVYNDGQNTGHHAYRIWSDNTIEVKFLGYTQPLGMTPEGKTIIGVLPSTPSFAYAGIWQTVDNGVSALIRADVDQSKQVDSGDISAVLLDFGNGTDENPPPAIDCTINAPR